MNGYTLFSSRRGLLSLMLVLAIGLSLPACDSLDVTDPNAPNAADVTLQSLVSGIEGGMRVDVFVYLVASGTLTREIYNFDPADPRWVDELFVGPLDPGGFIVLRPWASRYRVIRNTVTFMGRVASDLSGAGQSAASGFAKTIIAYQLLLNLNYMGDNSIKIEFSEDINTPFVSTDAAYAEIERYLDQGFSELQAGGGSFEPAFKLTGGFAGFDTPGTFAQFNRAIRARVALYQNDHSGALTALGNSFLDAGGSMNTGVYHVYSTGAGDRLHPLFEVPTSASVKLRAHPMYKAQAEDGDLRYTSKTLDRTNDDFDASPSSANGLSSALVVTVASGATAPLPIVRNEELLLMRAEANIGLNNLGPAETDINAVRAAAGLGAVTLTATNAIDQLLHERMYSLFLEGHRWVDVRRFDRFSELPIDRDGDQIFRQFPRPLDEVPEGN